MDDPLQLWLQRAESIPGVLACGVRCGNQPLIARSCHKDYPQPQIEKLLRELTETVRLLQTNRIPGEQLRWTFEHAWLYISIRHDGAIAALVVDNQAEMSPEIERLLSEFRADPASTG